MRYDKELPTNYNDSERVVVHSAQNICNNYMRPLRVYM